MDKIAVILPAHNEENSVGKVIDEVREALPQAAIFVVDNACTDDTATIAIAHGASVITEPRKGKGQAVRTALARISADYVFMLDADYTYPAIYLRYMLRLLDGSMSFEFGAVYGWRHIVYNEAMTLGHKIGNKALTYLAQWLFGTVTHDLCTGIWGFKGNVAKHLANTLTSNGFTLEADIYSSLALAKYELGSTIIHYRKREGSKAKLRILDGFKIALFLVKKRLQQ